MPGSLMHDDREYVIVASTPNWVRASHLADEVRKQIYGYEIKDWVDHLEDVLAYNGHTNLVLVDKDAWAAYDHKDRLLAYSQGYVDAE